MSASTKIITSVKNFYNQASDQFHLTRRRLFWPDIEPFFASVNPKSSILDLGCGNGRLLNNLPHSIRYTGIDISQGLLSKAKQSYPRHLFLEADITQEETWKNLPSFNSIFCLAVIHHLPTIKDQLFVLKQIKKHLRPQGKVLITAWNLWQPKYRRYHLDLKTKLQNIHHVYIPLQKQPRFCFAHTTLHLRLLLFLSGLKLKIKVTPHNYLLYTPS